jgi:hypothetical protein
MSSAMPSLKYSFSGSVLRFTNGRTAMDCGSPATVASPRTRSDSANCAMFD